MEDWGSNSSQVPPFCFKTNTSSACSDRRMAFRVANSNDLDAVERSKRSSLTNPNEIVLIECLSFPVKSLARGCHLSHVCFKTTTNGPWKMGIVSNMVYCLESQTTQNTQEYVPEVMHVYEWVGPVALSIFAYVPFIYYLNIYCDLGKHVCLKNLG